MKLKDACELAEECGLTTVGEAILNVELHATELFPYSSMNDELNELLVDAEPYEDHELIRNIKQEA